jgi:hypothetical protein
MIRVGLVTPTIGHPASKRALGLDDEPPRLSVWLLCRRLTTWSQEHAVSGRYDTLSGRFLGIDDDLDELLNRRDEIVARELYTLRILGS